MSEDKFVAKYGEDGKIVAIIDKRYWNIGITSMNEVLDVLNEQERINSHFVQEINKLRKLLKENTKPTTSISYGDVYLDIGDDKRCKYEDTCICDKCAYYSTYFLDCRLIMEDKQYKKALKLGLVKELEE